MFLELVTPLDLSPSYALSIRQFVLTRKVIPGSGEANIDSYVNNPYQTKQQRREQTVQDLLKKIPMDQIVLTLDENQFASLRPDLSDSSFTPHKSVWRFLVNMH